MWAPGFELGVCGPSTEGYWLSYCSIWQFTLLLEMHLSLVCSWVIYDTVQKCIWCVLFTFLKLVFNIVCSYKINIVQKHLWNLFIWYLYQMFLGKLVKNVQSLNLLKACTPYLIGWREYQFVKCIKYDSLIFLSYLHPSIQDILVRTSLRICKMGYWHPKFIFLSNLF